LSPDISNLLKTDKLSHLGRCPFREIECPLYSCKKPVPLCSLFDHLAEHHPDVELVSSGCDRVCHGSALLVTDERSETSF
jgi:hypothetical protein